jgi:dihydroorotate dehydrogenase electron transfer subunit
MVTLFLPLPEPGCAAPQGLDMAAFRPGRFFMLWLPRLDEKPYAVSYLDGERLGITVLERGPFSRRLCDLEPGATLGLRGPFGRAFWDYERHADSERAALVGGGCGMAVLAPLADRLPRASVVQGARSADGLLYEERFRNHVIFTDDGSAGRRGFPTEWLEERVEQGALDMVYTCGPEVMMAAVASICRRAGIGCQVSLERYMKCGIGVCGQCDCDGRRVCVEGPTFGLDELEEMPSFGRARRDKMGRRMPLSEADRCPSGPVPPPAPDGQARPGRAASEGDRP